MRTRDEIQRELDQLGEQDSNDDEITRLRDIIEELLADSATLDAIQALLSGYEWSADTIQEVAILVGFTGRVIRDVGEGS